MGPATAGWAQFWISPGTRSIPNVDQPTDILIALRLGELVWDDVRNGDKHFEDLTKCERTLCVIFAFEKEMCLEGFDLFFYSKAGSFAQEVLQACLAIEAYKAAEIFEKAIRLFPVHPPSQKI